MANEYLQRIPTSTGNRKVWTLAGWIKLQKSNFDGYLFQGINNSNNRTPLAMNVAKIQYRNIISGTAESIETKSLYRDAGSWMHFMLSIDTTQSDDPVERVKIYINGKLLSEDFNTAPNTSRNSDTFVNAATMAMRVFDATADGTELKSEVFDWFLVDGQALTPDVFGFYKQGKGYISVGSTQATDFRPGQWVPKTPRVIKSEINRRGGFGVNGFYLPMNDYRNFGADFHGEPNSIITLNEKLPQPRVGVASTASVGLGYTDALRADPYAANLVLALPFVSGGLQSGFGDYSAAIRGSGTPKTITNNGVSIASTASYYGSSSYFDSGNYLSTPNVSDFQFGTGDFTMEAWAYSFSGSWSIIAVQGTTSDAGRTLFGISNAGTINTQIGSQSLSSSAGIATSAQWNHVAFVRKNGVGTIYLNGVSVGINTVYTNSIQNTTLYVGSDQGWTNTSSKMYLQDLRVYKGVAKYTGGFDVPRPYTPVGIATWRQVPDTTANNFATLNPLGSGVLNRTGGTTPSATYSNGNLTAVLTQDSSSARSTIGVSTGKWYWEVRYDVNSSSPGNGIVGLTSAGTSYDDIAGASYEPRSDRFRKGGVTFYDGSNDKTSNGLIVGVALDKNVGIISFFADGVNQTNGTMIGINTLSDYHLPECFTYNDGASNTFSWNFGQNPTFSGNITEGTFTDTNGKGLFKYQPPSGFLALCEDNLPTPTISDPGKYFKTVLYTGDGASGRSIVGVGFTPDLVWVKLRDVSQSHYIFNSVRGAAAYLQSDTTGVETVSTSSLTSFNSDGFSYGNFAGGNYNTGKYVAWCWRAGAGTTSTNTNGSITSVVSVNQDAGFSVVSYTGTGSAGTVGHGLGKAPSFIIIKRRSGISDWAVYHKTIGTTGALLLNSTSATDTNRLPYWNDTVPTITTLGLGNGNNVNASSSNYIAYCWAEIEGFSKFGSYVGNGNADGPFIYTGGRPAFVMIKRTDISGENWLMYDAARNSVNEVNLKLAANSSVIENDSTIGTSSQNTLDFLSNGFKLRTTNTGTNASGGTYIYACWMESPFTTANSK